MNRTEMLKRLKNGEDPLELSILKWQDIVDGKGVNLGTGNCALCQTFLCFDCPVNKKNNGFGCEYTPYTQFIQKRPKPVRLRWARKELEFLKSLRKREEK